MKKVFSTFTKFVQSRPWIDWVVVSFLLVVFIGLASWNITGGSIWFDEAFSAYIIQFNFLDIARYTATDVHPPFFYWLLKLWSMMFGTSELGLRSMSVFFGVTAAIFAYLWARRQFGRRAAIIALGILVLSPLFIRYSQEARMYTLAATIIFAATYVMSRAIETKKRSLWILYGVLVSLGMWTHYFTALAWIAHWVWRFITLRLKGLKGKKLFASFFDRNWLTAYIIAVGLFLPWLPWMAMQLALIQSQGFWIGPVGVDTAGSYFGTLVFFLQSHQITGWFSAVLVAMGILLAVLSVTVYKKLNAAHRSAYILLLCLAAVPPIVLFIASLPPLTSSFVERYLLPAAIASALFSGVVLSVGLRGAAIWKKLVVSAVVLAMLISGLSTMYYYGNYNKNSRTGIETETLVRQVIEKSEPGEPIITNTPWVFYEATFYNSEAHPIYFIDETTDYYFGSLDMLKYNDQHKIKDLDAFMKEHPTVWFIGYATDELDTPRDNWRIIDQTSVTNKIDGATVYKGIEIIAE